MCKGRKCPCYAFFTILNFQGVLANWGGGHTEKGASSLTESESYLSTGLIRTGYNASNTCSTNFVVSLFMRE